MKYNLSAYLKTFSSKPNKKEAARISNQLQPVYIESIEEFIENVQVGVS